MKFGNYSDYAQIHYVMFKKYYHLENDINQNILIKNKNIKFYIKSIFKQLNDIINSFEEKQGSFIYNINLIKSDYTNNEFHITSPSPKHINSFMFPIQLKRSNSDNNIKKLKNSDEKINEIHRNLNNLNKFMNKKTR